MEVVRDLQIEIYKCIFAIRYLQVWICKMLWKLMVVK